MPVCIANSLTIKKCWGFLGVCSKFNEEMKQNHKQWAEMVLQGFKQRLHECGKIGKTLYSSS